MRQISLRCSSAPQHSSWGCPSLVLLVCSCQISSFLCQHELSAVCMLITPAAVASGLVMDASTVWALTSRCDLIFGKTSSLRAMMRCGAICWHICQWIQWPQDHNHDMQLGDCGAFTFPITVQARLWHILQAVLWQPTVDDPPEFRSLQKSVHNTILAGCSLLS